MTAIQALQAQPATGGYDWADRANCVSLKAGKYSDIIAVSGDPLSDVRYWKREVRL